MAWRDIFKIRQLPDVSPNISPNTYLVEVRIRSNIADNLELISR